MSSNVEDTPMREGHSYEAFEKAWAEKLKLPLAGLDRKQRRYHYYSRYNKDRSVRVQHTYQVSPELRSAIEEIDTSQHWMVLTEDWCVDSAFCLPVMVAAARLNPLIDLRILLRDDNLDIMDQYLTGTSRSIPKMVAFSSDGNEIFRWGPRPDEARLLRERLLAKGVSGGVVSQRLIEWYEDGGWRQVDTELIALLEQVQRMA